MPTRRELDKMQWEWQVCAYHEAGHAVALLALDFELNEINIGVRAGFWSGVRSHGGTNGGVPESDDDTDGVDDYLVTCLSGPAAELRFGSPQADVLAHMEGDLRNAEGALPHASLTLGEAEDEAHELVDGNWDAIVAVAEALMDNDGYLSGADVEDIVG